LWDEVQAVLTVNRVNGLAVILHHDFR
jgi:hypothetical protein